nr:plasmid pRiA4b ORF-3 family protein [Burkholderia sp. ABCPW 11]
MGGGPAAETARTPRCVAGAGACPPEDCGGPAGYAELGRTLAGRMTDEKRDLHLSVRRCFGKAGPPLPRAADPRCRPSRRVAADGSARRGRSGRWLWRSQLHPDLLCNVSILFSPVLGVI